MNPKQVSESESFNGHLAEPGHQTHRTSSSHLQPFAYDSLGSALNNSSKLEFSGMSNIAENSDQFQPAENVSYHEFKVVDIL